LGRFTEPTRLRGTAFLAIERTDRNSDYFVYLPAFRKVRRVSAYQVGVQGEVAFDMNF